MKAAIKPFPSAEEEAEIDRLLGDQLLFDVDEPQKRGGPSPPVIFRAERAGLIELLRNGGRTKLDSRHDEAHHDEGASADPVLVRQAGRGCGAKADWKREARLTLRPSLC